MPKKKLFYLNRCLCKKNHFTQLRSLLTTYRVLFFDSQGTGHRAPGVPRARAMQRGGGVPYRGTANTPITVTDSTVTDSSCRGTCDSACQACWQTELDVSISFFSYFILTIPLLHFLITLISYKKPFKEKIKSLNTPSKNRRRL